MTTEPEFTIDAPNGHMLDDGRAARIICADRVGGLPIIALITDQGTTQSIESVVYFSSDGFSANRMMRLANKPVPKRKFVRWVNFYDSTGEATWTYLTKDAADKAARRDRIACIRVEFEEGEGL